MIPRYSRPQMAAIWAPENRFRIWFEIEAHACDAMAELGVIPKDAAKAIWAGGKKAMEALKADPAANIAEDRRHRAGDQARRDRLHHLAGRVHRAAVALRAPGPDLVGRARHHLRRPAHPGRRHPDGRRRQAAGGTEEARAGAQGHAHHRPQPRHPCRAHDLRRQARRPLRRLRPQPRPRWWRRGPRSRPAPSRARSAPSPTSIPGSRSMWRKQARPRGRAGVDAGHPARPARRVLRRAGRRRLVDREPRHRDPPSAAHRSARGRGVLLRGPEGQLVDAAQAQSGADRERHRPRPRGARAPSCRRWRT